MDLINNQLILYLTYDGLTDPLGQSQILPYLIGLSHKGFQFHIISFEKKEAFRRQKEIIQRQLVGYSIVWHPQVYHKFPPVLSAMYDVAIMRKMAFELHKEYKFGAVWCRSYLPGMVGMALKRKTGLKFIFDMRGFWPDERVEGGTWPQNNPLYRMVYTYFKNKEKEMLAEADHVVVLTHKAKAILETQRLHKNPVPKAVSVIPCCVDTDHFNLERISESEKEFARQKLRLTTENKILVYAGSVGTWYMLDEMFDYFKNLQQEDNSWRFLLISRDEKKTIIQKAKEKEIEPAFIIVTPATREEMPLYLSLGSKAISYIQPSFSKQASSPTKLAEYLAMGLPCECNEGVGDVDTLINQFNDLRSKKEIQNIALEKFSLSAAIIHYSETLSFNDS
ncbi:MAG: glycosyltransferase [Cyclobacteriaceae bacterium]|nr:glycosyltransferase [Cyclobacteriaceae bacterium]